MTPIPIEFKKSGSNKTFTGELEGYTSYSVRIRETGVLTHYFYHAIDWIREV